MTSDYQRIAAAISYLQDHADEQPRLATIAASVGLSPYHLQRLFTRWAGVSPKRYLEYLSVDRAKPLLRAAAGVLETSLSVGLSGPGRLHDQFVSLEAVTPGQYGDQGAGLTIGYGWCDSPFGRMLIGQTPRGVCWLSFHDLAEDPSGLEQLRAQWPQAELVRDTRAIRDTGRRIFATGSEVGTPLNILVTGTNFQLQVWRALLALAPGQTLSYGQLAERIGKPRAARALGSALAANAVSYLIPCHRVITGQGQSGNYRWGPLRKRTMLIWEGARRDDEQQIGKERHRGAAGD